MSAAVAEAVGLYLWDLPARLEPAELCEGITAVTARPEAASGRAGRA